MTVVVLCVGWFGLGWYRVEAFCARKPFCRADVASESTDKDGPRKPSLAQALLTRAAAWSAASSTGRARGLKALPTLIFGFVWCVTCRRAVAWPIIITPASHTSTKLCGQLSKPGRRVWVLKGSSSFLINSIFSPFDRVCSLNHESKALSKDQSHSSSPRASRSPQH